MIHCCATNHKSPDPSQPLLFETICIRDGKPLHLDYHNARMNRSRRELFHAHDTLDLTDYLSSQPHNKSYRAKVVYNVSIKSVDYFPYRPKRICRFKIIESSTESPMEYSHKFLDRSCFEDLFTMHSDYDEILLARDGLLTDTTIANIALKQNGIWYTPSNPLLPGTTRARLLNEKKLRLRDIRMDDIDRFDGLALMNAMIGFSIINTPTITR